MFNFLRSKGVTQLRSVNTDYELINQIYQRLKSLNDSEISSRKGFRDNNVHRVLGELHKQHQILEAIDYILKVKTLRLGELNKTQEENARKRIKQLKKDMDSYVKEHKRHMSTVKGKEDKRHTEYLNRHREERTRRYKEEIAHLNKIIEETKKFKNSLRKSTQKGIEDSQRVLYNV